MPRHACSAPCRGTAPMRDLAVAGRWRACPNQPDRLSSPQCVVVTQKSRAQRAKACGYVDNARALPTSPQAQQKLQQDSTLVMTKQGLKALTDSPHHIALGSMTDFVTNERRHICADPDRHSQQVRSSLQWRMEEIALSNFAYLERQTKVDHQDGPSPV